MRRRVALVFLLLGLTLSACGGPPESRVALSEPGKTAYDERLVGIWYRTDGKKAIYLHISRRKETAYLEVVGIFVVYNEADPVLWLRATAHASEIDGKTYYNVKRVVGAGFDYTAPGESPGFIIARADVPEQDTLLLRFMGWSFGESNFHKNKKTRVKGRRFEGKYKDTNVPYRMLDLSRPELIALIRKNKKARVKDRRFKGKYNVPYRMLDLSRPELMALIREVTPAKFFKEGMRFRRLRPEAENVKP
ncbi:MAG: hypothetical protein IH904_05350 [Proteobacteria bacterium]|nr:hypothetical protein [Pseudomonadota bacterium]